VILNANQDAHAEIADYASQNGIRMVDWVANMLEGQRSHVSP
jgi:hypothetical protein